jgi:hypothetical protein
MFNIKSKLTQYVKRGIRLYDYEKTNEGYAVMYEYEQKGEFIIFTWKEIAPVLLSEGVIDEIEELVDRKYVRMFTYSYTDALDDRGRWCRVQNKDPFLYEAVEISPDILKQMIAVRELEKDLAKSVTGSILSLIKEEFKPTAGKLFT